MNTLQDAWDWYESARTNLHLMQRLGTKYWDDDFLNEAIWKDDKFKNLEATDIQEGTTRALEPLNDLGILVLFSVFEAAVRDHLEEIIRPMTGHLGHPILEHAAEKVLEGIKLGSFANKVLTPLQDGCSRAIPQHYAAILSSSLRRP